MLKSRKLLLSAGILVALVAVPLTAMAADDSESTTINAEIASVISVTTSTTVTINVTPVSGGSQTSASDTVTVATNDASGYTLTLANSDTDTDLEDGANAIAAHAGTLAEPTALANNSWGYAVAGLGDFDESYTIIDNAGSSSTLWAGVPEDGDEDIIRTHDDVTAGQATTVWYSVKADTSKPGGTYSDTVTYTATTNP